MSLAAWALLLALARMTLAFLENQRVLAQTHTEARTDSLTGLKNRRSLMADLELQLELSSPAAPRALLLFDLDGFKEYNDAFGHPAGDELLARLGVRLADVVGSSGHAYRLGGDEFCALLLPGREGVGPLVAACSLALTERGEGFEVGSSFGVRAPPGGGHDAHAGSAACRQAHVCPQGRAPDVRRAPVPRRRCCRTLSERQPRPSAAARATSASWRSRSGASCRWARRSSTRWRARRRAPRRRQDRRSRRDPRQARPARRRSSGASCAATRSIGERILLEAPALRPVARLVRSSHERCDGGGYPDGLRGDEIPLGARVVAVCDAFDAMTTDRPYRQPVAEEEALAGAAPLCRDAVRSDGGGSLLQGDRQGTARPRRNTQHAVLTVRPAEPILRI